MRHNLASHHNTLKLHVIILEFSTVKTNFNYCWAKLVRGSVAWLVVGKVKRGLGCWVTPLHHNPVLYKPPLLSVYSTNYSRCTALFSLKYVAVSLQYWRNTLIS